jgi:hypothetical protein
MDTVDIPGYGASVDAVVSLARFVEREWGAYGRRMSVIGRSDGAAFAECVCVGDGARWWVAVDRYGVNLCSADTFAGVRDLLEAAEAGQRDRMAVAS